MVVIRKKREPKPEDPRAEQFYKYAGRRIRRLREALGLTQKKLADRAGFTTPSINQIEQGKQRPPLIALLQIWEAFMLRAVDFDEPVAKYVGFRLLIPTGALDFDDDAIAVADAIERRVVTLPKRAVARSILRERRPPAKKRPAAKKAKAKK